MYKITAVLKSPLMIGGKTLNSNYRESRDYIPGSVLRAAYAKALIQRCAYEQKNFWLEYKEQDQCKGCEFQRICKNFAEISFPTLYPMGASPYPITAREKKYRYEGTKSVLDILKSRLTAQKKTNEESGWKRLEGFHKEGEKIKLLHSAITRTAIDYHRNAAKESALYTQNVIVERYLDQDHKLADVMFSGTANLTPEEEKELSKIKVLHIGADITRGFGICHMSCEKKADDDTPEKIEERIREFNLGINVENPYIVLDLLTDAYLELEEIGENTQSQTQFTDEQMRMFLEEKLGFPREKYQLYKVFKSQEMLRGFDTSKDTERKMRRKSHLVVKAGAVFVYQISSDKVDGKELLELEKRGIGKHTEHGFGKIRICDEFHVKYDILRGCVGINKELEMLTEQVMKRETKRFLDEIERLMSDEGGGVKRALMSDEGKDEKEDGKSKSKIGRTQFKTLMDAAGKASCVEELVLFLAYQESKDNGWKKKCNNKETIADKIRKSLESIVHEIYGLIESENGAEKINEDSRRKIKLMIAEKYMGYLYWKASIVCNMRGDKNV